MRADTIFGGADDYGFQLQPGAANGGSNNRLTNYYYTRARMDLTVDTRTATEYGVVRTYADMIFSYDYRPTSPAATRRRSRPEPPRSASTMRSSSSLASPSVARSRSSTLRGRAIRLAVPIPFRAARNHVTGINQFAYTADFGQGITGSIAFGGPDDAVERSGQPVEHRHGCATRSLLHCVLEGTYGTNAWGGNAFSRHRRCRSVSTRPGVCAQFVGCRA